MRGEFVIGTASFLSFVAVILLIFTHVGQMNTSSVPRALSMVTINITGFGPAIEEATGDPVPDLYNTTPSAPLRSGLGLRPLYKWGFYSHCGYTAPDFNATTNPSPDLSKGSCSNSSFAYSFEPYDTIQQDSSTDNQVLTRNIFGFLPDSVAFKNPAYTGTLSKAACYLVLFGSMAAFISFISGLYHSTLTFLISSTFAFIGTVCLLIAASIWTALVNRTAAINSYVIPIGPQGTMPLGVTVEHGTGLWLLWSAFVLLALSVFPYILSCKTYVRR